MPVAALRALSCAEKPLALPGSGWGRRDPALPGAAPGRALGRGQHECPEAGAWQSPSNSPWAFPGMQVRQGPGGLPLHFRVSLHGGKHQLQLVFLVTHFLSRVQIHKV